MSGTHPLVEVRDAARWFDVSPPWLERKLSGKPKVMLRAVDGVSFDIARGETLALVGESGCGKSTVARMLVGLYGLTRGDIRFDGQPLAGMAESGGRAMRKRLQMIFQDPYASLNPRWRVGRIIAEPMLTHTTMTPAERTARVGQLLKQVGLDPADQGRYPHQFSGGQRQRIGIARALALKPSVIVCDEAVAALDVSIQAQVLNLFERLRGELDLTYLFISHNLSVVSHISDRVAIMYLGRVVELAPTDEIFQRANHPYTQALLKELPTLTPGRRAYRPIKGELPSPLDPPTGCAFHPRCPQAMPRCKTERPLLRAIAPGHVSACHLNDEGAAPASASG